MCVDERQLCVGFDLRIQRVMQLQREIGVFGRIVGRRVDGHFVEADLVDALAADFLVGDRPCGPSQRCARSSKRARGAIRAHRPAAWCRARRRRSAMPCIGEHMGVVFGVMRQLGRAGVLQPGLQARQHLVPSAIASSAIRAADGPAGYSMPLPGSTASEIPTSPACISDERSRFRYRARSIRRTRSRPASARRCVPVDHGFVASPRPAADAAPRPARAQSPCGMRSLQSPVSSRTHERKPVAFVHGFERGLRSAAVSRSRSASRSGICSSGRNRC